MQRGCSNYVSCRLDTRRVIAAVAVGLLALTGGRAGGQSPIYNATSGTQTVSGYGGMGGNTLWAITLPGTGDAQHGTWKVTSIQFAIDNDNSIGMGGITEGFQFYNTMTISTNPSDTTLVNTNEINGSGANGNYIDQFALTGFTHSTFTYNIPSNDPLYITGAANGVTIGVQMTGWTSTARTSFNNFVNPVLVSSSEGAPGSNPTVTNGTSYFWDTTQITNSFSNNSCGNPGCNSLAGNYFYFQISAIAVPSTNSTIVLAIGLLGVTSLVRSRRPGRAESPMSVGQIKGDSALR